MANADMLTVNHEWHKMRKTKKTFLLPHKDFRGTFSGCSICGAKKKKITEL